RQSAEVGTRGGCREAGKRLLRQVHPEWDVTNGELAARYILILKELEDGDGARPRPGREANPIRSGQRRAEARGTPAATGAYVLGGCAGGGCSLLGGTILFMRI